VEGDWGKAERAAFRYRRSRCKAGCGTPRFFLIGREPPPHPKMDELRGRGNQEGGK